MPYEHVNYRLSPSQIQKLSDGYKSKTSVTLTLNKDNIDVRSNNTLLLTQNEREKLNDGKSHRITFAHSRVVKNGGFLPFLIPILAGLGAAAGISGGIGGTVADAKKAAAADAERKAAEAQKKFYEDASKQGSGMKKKGRIRIGKCNGTPTFLYGE